MIARILIAAAAVIACFFTPSLVASQHTELWDLLQDGVMSGVVIVLMLRGVGGVTGILICIIEAFLIAVAALYGWHYENRHTFYLAMNYTPIHDGAFLLELAIIGTRTLFGLREIGADASRIITNNAPRSVGLSDSGRH